MDQGPPRKRRRAVRHQAQHHAHGGPIRARRGGLLVSGGLPGDLVPTNDIPLAWPNSVEADDNFIYVSDMLNARLLRLRKTFATTETVKVE